MADHYLGNPKLKKANIHIDFSQEEIQEVVKCSKAVSYTHLTLPTSDLV